MKIEIQGDPGTGNTYTEIHIDRVENYNPSASNVITKHYYIDGRLIPAGKVLTGEMAKVQTGINKDSVRAEILEYVSNLRPILADEWKSRYMQVWGDILDLGPVAARIYNRGKQQGTNFNRNLVGNILCYLAGRGAYRDEYNASQAALMLEDSKDHSIRRALGTMPETAILPSLNRYFENRDL